MTFDRLYAMTPAQLDRLESLCLAMRDWDTLAKIDHVRKYPKK